MVAMGFNSLFPQDRLAVMGFIDPLKRLPELLRIRKTLAIHFTQNPPAVFVGIDAPDFNLGLEKRLKVAGVRTAHYVSPSVWAWRQGRIKTIAKAVDLMLTLLPFEKAFYDAHQVQAKFVGHPLADDIPLQADAEKARRTLGLDTSACTAVVALLPGSRGGEVERLAPVFLYTARRLSQVKPGVKFLIPAANEKRKAQLTPLLEAFEGLDVHVFDGQSHEVMAAADVVLMASGTTTLEALLLKRPMVIAYKLAGFSFWLMSKLAKVPYVGLPNLLAGKAIVPEYLQAEAEPKALCQALLTLLEDPEHVAQLVRQFDDIHQTLRQNASERAAAAIVELIQEGAP